MKSLFEVVRTYAEAQPDALALVTEEDGSRTYAQLADRSAALAAALERVLGLTRDERICLVLPNHPAWLECHIAASAAGIGMAALDPQWTDTEIAFALERCAAAAVVCLPDLAPRLTALRSRLPRLRDVVVVGVATATTVSYESLIAASPAPSAAARVQPSVAQPPAHIVFTSGTTAGRPKAVVRRIRAGTGRVDYGEMFGLTTADRALVVTPFFHMNGLGGAMSAINNGASVVFPRRFSARRFWHLVDLYRPTYLFTLAPIVNILLSRPVDARERRHGLRVAIVPGAGRGDAAIEERLGVPTIDWYGMTEAIGNGTYTRLGQPRKPGSAGTRAPRSTMTILREDGAPAAPNEPGEVVFDRASIAFDGYLDDPEATDAVSDERWFRTGDIGYFDEDGYFFFVDRMKDIVRRGGKNVSSLEVEDAIRSIPGVVDVAVVGKPDEVLGERVVAFVVTATAFDPEQVRRRLGEVLAPYKIPEELFTVDEFPRTPTGKVRKRDLKERLR